MSASSCPSEWMLYCWSISVVTHLHTHTYTHAHTHTFISRSTACVDSCLFFTPTQTKTCQESVVFPRHHSTHGGIPYVFLYGSLKVIRKWKINATKVHNLHFKVWIIISCDYTWGACAPPLNTNSSLTPRFLRGNYRALPRLRTVSILHTYLRAPWNGLSPLLTANHLWAPRRQDPEGGRSFAWTLPGWSLSGAQTWACNWLRQPPLVLAANKVKVHHQWQLALCGNTACHVIKNRISKRKMGVVQE